MKYFMFCFASTVIGISVLGLIRNAYVYRTMTMLRRAIHAYNMDQIEQLLDPDFYLYKRIDKYDEYFLRFWDWGLDWLLSEEDMEKLRPYLRKE